MRLAADKLNNAINPVIALGGGAAADAALMVQLAEVLDAPVTTTHNAKGILPPEHSLYIGGSPTQAEIQALYAEADVVLAIGTELGETDYDFFFSENTRMSDCLIRVDIDPRQFSRNEVPAIAILGDSVTTIRALLPYLTRTPKNGAERVTRLRDTMEKDKHPDYDRFFATLQQAAPPPNAMTGFMALFSLSAASRKESGCGAGGRGNPHELGLMWLASAVITSSGNVI